MFGISHTILRSSPYEVVQNYMTNEAHDSTVFHGMGNIRKIRKKLYALQVDINHSQKKQYNKTESKFKFKLHI